MAMVVEYQNISQLPQQLKWVQMDENIHDF